ncbi:MAG TPA: hypothetical protein VJ201_08065 [Candidatus Babeliales bacterium]|nr:hypothetical protein [Candidatus Babeliales bacterium]
MNNTSKILISIVIGLISFSQCFGGPLHEACEKVECGELINTLKSTEIYPPCNRFNPGTLDASSKQFKVAYAECHKTGAENDSKCQTYFLPAEKFAKDPLSLFERCSNQEHPEQCVLHAIKFEKDCENCRKSALNEAQKKCKKICARIKPVEDKIAEENAQNFLDMNMALGKCTYKEL